MMTLRATTGRRASAMLGSLGICTALFGCGRIGYEARELDDDHDGSTPLSSDASSSDAPVRDGAVAGDAAASTYCFGPSFPDPEVDYDSDGIPCGQDPCIFDGPSAQAYPASVGPIDELTVSAVDVASTGRTVATVSPGASFTVAFDYFIQSCACTTCITQGLAGLADNAGTPACFYNGIPRCSNAGMGRASITLDAPATAGMYPLRFLKTWEFECVLTHTMANPSTDFAAICVMP